MGGKGVLGHADSFQQSDDASGLSFDHGESGIQSVNTAFQPVDSALQPADSVAELPVACEDNARERDAHAENREGLLGNSHVNTPCA